jgi:hypothetical protein
LRASENRNRRIFAGCGEYLINFVGPLYADSPILHLDIDRDVSALDSTAVSLGIKLFSRAPGKYSRGAVKIHTMTDLRGSIPFLFSSLTANITAAMYLTQSGICRTLYIRWIKPALILKPCFA